MATVASKDQIGIAGFTLGLTSTELPSGYSIHILSAQSAGGASGFSVLRTPDGAAYQPTNDAVIYAAQVRLLNNSADANLALLYADTSAGHLGTVPTNPVYYQTNSSTAANFIIVPSGISPYVNDLIIGFEVPATKYPHVAGTTTDLSATFIAIES